MTPEKKEENNKINEISKSLLSNFNNAKLSKYHQNKIVNKMKQLLNQ